MTVKIVRALIPMVFLFAGITNAAERYTEAHITQIESSDIAIYVFLRLVSGDTPPSGNGGSNEPLSKSYLLLANTPEDIAARKHLLSSALVALSNGALVRFRWEDTTSRITHLLVRAD